MGTSLVKSLARAATVRYMYVQPHRRSEMETGCLKKVAIKVIFARKSGARILKNE